MFPIVTWACLGMLGRAGVYVLYVTFLVTFEAIFCSNNIWNLFKNLANSSSGIWLIAKYYPFWYIIADGDEFTRLKQRFAHVSDFFELMDATRSHTAYGRAKKNLYTLAFKCNLCFQIEQKDKILKSNTQAPYSNLKRHVDMCHPETLVNFNCSWNIMICIF